MTSLLDLLRDPLFRSTVLTLWLLPCAIQDRRTRHVSNWLTVPLFFLAWPAALVFGNLTLTLATFVGVYLTFNWLRDGFGAADGKIAVGLAGICPIALLISLAVQIAMFLVCRLRGHSGVHLPGAVGYYAGTAAATLLVLARHTLTIGGR